MRDLKPFFLFVTALTLLVAFPGPMTHFIHYTTMLELYARFNPSTFYPVAGIMWATSFYWILRDWIINRPREVRTWTVEESVLNEYNGKSKGLGTSKPVVIQEVHDDSHN